MQNLAERLKISEDRFRVALKNSPITLIELDCDLRFKWIYNPLIGKSVEEIVGKKVGETETVKDITLLREFYLDVLRTGEAKRSEIVLDHFNRVATYDIYAEPLRDEKGQIIGLTSASTDITERRQAEKDLKQNQKDLMLAQAVSKTGSWRVTVQGNLYWSDETYRIFGVPKGAPMTYECFLSYIHPEDRAYVDKEWREALKGKPYDIEHRLIVDGKIKWVRETAQLEFENDKLVSGFGTVQDITERKKAERSLRDSEERFRLVAEAAKVMVYEINIGSDVVNLFRGEEVVGYEKGEVPSSNNWWISQIHPDDRAAVEQQVNAAVEAGRDVLLEYRVKCKQGNYIIVHDMTKMVKNEQGQVIRIVGGVRDVTERKRAEQRLEEYKVHLEQLVNERTKQLQEKERLAAIGATAGMVGHDIRNPLQAMTSDVYLLKEYLTSMPEMQMKNDVAESLEGLEKNISYVNKIVADLQDYARPLNPECSDVELSDVINSVFKTVELPDNIKLSIDIKVFAKMKTEPTFIRRSLTNLVNNALQAMPDGGNLTINAFEKTGKVIITVEDTGVGIPEEVKPKLFTPMMTTKSKGQGLGLAVVKRLIEALDGTITFESQEGKGTKFTIEIPCVGKP